MSHSYLVREIILKYHRGEPLTAEEQAILDAEIARLPSDKVWDKIRAHVEAEPKVRVMRPWYVRWPAITAGAAAVVIVIAGGLYRYANKPGNTGKLAIVQRVWRTIAPGHFYQETEGPTGIEVMDSAKGGQADPYAVILPDGSKVTLSYGSSVRYAQAFAERKVVLSGQAHFDVVSDVRPFIVESGGTMVQVLGTQFNWMHYPGMPEEITLLGGKIRLSRGNFQRELQPADRAVIHEGNPVRVKIGKLRKPEETVAWMETHSIVFDSTDLCQVIQRLAHYYQVDFHVDPKFQSGSTVSGVMDLDRPLADNLASIAATVKDYATVEQREGKIEVN